MRIAPSAVPTLSLGNQRSIRGFENLPESKKRELSKLEAACNDFESIFVFQMMKEMRKTVNKTRLVNGGFAEEVFTDMLDQERARSYSLGVGNLLFKQLSQSIVPPARRR